jgi:two-component system sensor histidine kinase VicK
MAPINSPVSVAHKFLAGGGEMGQLTRSFNWSENVLRSPETWPHSLLATVSLILNSRFPMFLWWGPNLIQFYNDAYRPSLGINGKHPSALGQRGEDCWPEIWPVIKPLIDQVLQDGESTWSEDQLIPIYRNNKLEDVYWTFSYSKVRDDEGEIAGVLVTCNETTQKILSYNAIKEAESRFRSMIEQSSVPMLVTKGEDMIFEEINPAMLQLINRDISVKGKPWFVAMPELKDQPIIEQLYHTYRTGEEWTGRQHPVIVKRKGKPDMGYYDISYKPLIINDEIIGVLQVAVDVTEQVSAFNTIEQARHDLELAIEAAELGTWDLNPKTDYFTGNARLKSWFGLPQDEEIDVNNALSAIIEADRENVILAIQKAIAKGSDGNYSVIYTIINQKDKTQRVVKASGKALFDADGDAYRFNGILQDVTDDYQIQQRKDEFISVASHELKTPITTLNASMQILQRLMKTDPASDKVPLFINKANNNLNKLVRLLDDLLNVTRIQQGQLALNKTMFNLVDLVNDCCDHVRADGNHEIVLSGNKELMVFADYRRMDQVLVNLVNNAVKYAPQSKKIDIHIDHYDGFAEVSVRDYGIGIHPEKLPHLFDRYYRVDSLGHQFSGLGLGLYISSEIVHRHGGEIGVESTRGTGSRFWFTLPMND